MNLQITFKPQTIKTSKTSCIPNLPTQLHMQDCLLVTEDEGELPSVFQADNNTDSSNKMEVVTVNRGVAAFPNDTYQDCCDKAKLITACNTDN